jgi:hypothetical protein
LNSDLALLQYYTTTTISICVLEVLGTFFGEVNNPIQGGIGPNGPAFFPHLKLLGFLLSTVQN